MAIMEENDYQVTGLDLSRDMLEIARGRCRGELIWKDMREIQVDDHFDAIVCMGKGFCYMLTDEDVNMALVSFNRALREGGILILDCFDAEKSRQYQYGDWRETVFDFEGLKITRLTRSSDYREGNGTWLVEWEYIIEDGERRIVKDRTRLRSFDKNQLLRMLERHGFRVIKTRKDGDLILQAEKVEGQPT